MGDETKLSNVYLKSIGQKFDLEIIFILDLSYKSNNKYIYNFYTSSGGFV